MHLLLIYIYHFIHVPLFSQQEKIEDLSTVIAPIPMDTRRPTRRVGADGKELRARVNGESLDPLAEFLEGLINRPIAVAKIHSYYKPMALCAAISE